MKRKLLCFLVCFGLMVSLTPNVMANAPQIVTSVDGVQTWASTEIPGFTINADVLQAFVANNVGRRIFAVTTSLGSQGQPHNMVLFFAVDESFTLSDGGSSASSFFVRITTNSGIMTHVMNTGSAWPDSTSTRIVVYYSQASGITSWQWPAIRSIEIRLPEPLRAIALWRNNVWQDLATTAFIGPVQPITFPLPQPLELSVHGFARVELRTVDNQLLHNAAVPADKIVDIPMTAIPSWYTLSDLRIIGFTTMGQTVVNPAHVWQLPIMATIPLASGQIVSPIHGQAITVGPTQPIPVTVTHGATAGAEWKVRSWDVSRQVAREHILAPIGTNRMSTSMTGLQSGRHALALVAIITGVEQTVSRIEIDVIQQVAGQEPIEPIPSPIPAPPELGENATLIDRVVHGFEMVIYWITLPFIGIANMVTAITSALGNLVSNTGGFFSMFNMIWGFFPPEIRTGFAVMTPLLLVLWAVKR